MAIGTRWEFDDNRIFCELLESSEGLLNKTIKQKYLGTKDGYGSIFSAQTGQYQTFEPHGYGADGSLSCG